MGVEGQGEEQDRILVSVRLRPLNGKEIQSNDFVDWETIDDHTILFKNCLGERSMLPNSYTFDRVFGFESTTNEVYEKAAKQVALSVLNGFNSSVFAYGQTSSGKTFTMGGITQNAVSDIYDYIAKHPEREFVLKFSAMEIYNEQVRDLLSVDPTPLRLLDDPEKGTVVDKLTEEPVMDETHLLELIAVCEDLRQTGETSLNETSSRSHQILRLTIESSARQFSGGNPSLLTASVNFVDLAGSERTSQTQTTGTRLKEGSHINRSLLTLGKVIRKLSKGRNGHVPYRDSKLTRILHNSLGGNARTAIICTMSPAHSHLEQTRNTLMFASCAKEVTNNAKVNVIMSDKALVKHLRKELSRLERELTTMSLVSTKGDVTAVLKEKESQIEKMGREIKELSHQRDLAQSKVEQLLQSSGSNRGPRQLDEGSSHRSTDSREKLSWLDGSSSFTSDTTDYQHLDSDLTTSESFKYLDEQVNFDFNHQMTNDSLENRKEEAQLQEPEAIIPSQKGKEDELGKEGNEPEKITPQQQETENKEVDEKQQHHHYSDSEYEALVRRINDLQSTIDRLVKSGLDERVGLKLNRSRSCKAVINTTATCPVMEKVSIHSREKSFGGFEKQVSSRRPMGLFDASLSLSDANNGSSTGLITSIRTHFMNESDNSSIYGWALGTNEDNKEESDKDTRHDTESGVAKYKRLLQRCGSEGRFRYSIKAGNLAEDHQNTDVDASFAMKIRNYTSEEARNGVPQSTLGWEEEFEHQRNKIIELWHDCNTPLVHRTYFFLLFKGDPSDKLYMEVELRRLSFIKERFSQGQKIVMDGQVFTASSSLQALNEEREMLTRHVYKKIPDQERAPLYQKWGIAVTSKERRLQLVRRLWTDPKDMQNVNDSANLVAKLVGFIEGGQVPKEMFVGPSFVPRTLSRRSYSWKAGMSYI